MRILIVSNLFPPIISGGYEIECRQVADQLYAKGHEICILTTDYESEFGIHEEVSYSVKRVLKLILPFHTPFISAHRFKKWKIGRYNFAQTEQVINQFKPDVLFHWSPLRIGMQSARAAMKYKIPIAWRIGDDNIGGIVPSSFSWNPRQCIRYLLDNTIIKDYTTKGIDFDFVSVISHATKKKLITDGLPFQKAEVLIKGIPLEKFPAKNQLGKISYPIQLLYTGRLYPSKGVHTAILASHQVANDHPIVFTIVGNGSKKYTDFLHDLAGKGKAKIHFKGVIRYENLSTIYQGSDIFIFPSIGIEGMGATLQEAMSSGLPIVSTCYGGPEDFLLDRVNALFFPGDDIEQLSRAIETLINDEELRVRLAKDARKTALERFSLESYCESIEKFLYKAVEKKLSE